MQMSIIQEMTSSALADGPRAHSYLVQRSPGVGTEYLLSLAPGVWTWTEEVRGATRYATRTEAVAGMAMVDADASEACVGSEVSGCHPGATREQMTSAEEVAWLAEVDALPERTQDIPDQPASLCWDCRCLAHWGQGPQAQAIRARVGMES
jgi:hypothetical protein